MPDRYPIKPDVNMAVAHAQSSPGLSEYEGFLARVMADVRVATPCLFYIIEYALFTS